MRVGGGGGRGRRELSEGENPGTREILVYLANSTCLYTCPTRPVLFYPPSRTPVLPIPARHARIPLLLCCRAGPKPPVVGPYQPGWGGGQGGMFDPARRIGPLPQMSPPPPPRTNQPTLPGTPCGGAGGGVCYVKASPAYRGWLAGWLRYILHLQFVQF